MQKFFVRHKLKVDDITYLSDSDSELVIKEGILDIEDVVEIETYEKIFYGQISDIAKGSVEIQIIEEKGKRESEYVPSIAIIQALSNESKFDYFLEKSVEIGIEKIIPIQSKYSLKTKSKAIKNTGHWNKLVRDAVEQSRNIKPTIIEKPIYLRDLTIEKSDNLVCLTTENVDSVSLKEYLSSCEINKPFVIAIGPEKGWSSKDIEILKEKGFKFIRLSGNILRTETSSLVIGSIVKYLKGEI